MTADRSILSSPSAAGKFSSESARQTLRLACRAAGLDDRGARLLRLGTNANYRLTGAPIMVRISPGRANDVRKEVAVARWLARHHFPAARLIEDIDQPLELDGRLITFWGFIEEGDKPATVVDVALLLRELHQLPGPETFTVPRFEPLDHTARRLKSAGDGKDARFLRKRCTELQERYAGLDFPLRPGVIHGDAHDKNAIRDKNGTVRLLDFESFAWGPREWDLAVLALRYQPFGWISDEEYRACVGAYGGFDVTKWPGYPVLQAIRELSMTTWLLQNVGESVEHDTEFRKRMADLRDDDAPRHWRPF